MKLRILTLLFLISLSGYCNVTLPKVLGDNMVLQRNKPINIWGWADKGEKVTIQFNKQSASAKADKNGKWFITLKPEAGITRKDLIAKLTEANIGTRLLFAGDIRKQPYFKNVDYHCIGNLPNTETILHNTFWIGVTPMITGEMIDFMIETFIKILK